MERLFGDMVTIESILFYYYVNHPRVKLKTQPFMIDKKYFFLFLGFGYADVENRVLATPNHIMRIASISKPLAMVAAAR